MENKNTTWEELESGSNFKIKESFFKESGGFNVITNHKNGDFCEWGSNDPNIFINDIKSIVYLGGIFKIIIPIIVNGNIFWSV